MLGAMLALNATLTGVFNWFGWVIAVYLFVALGFGYFQFLAPPE